MRTCLLIALCLSCTASAQDKLDEASKSKIADAKTAFLQEVEKAKHELTVAMDTLLRETAKTGDLNAVEALLKQHDALKTDGTLPTTGKLEEATQNYKKSLRESLLATKEIFDELIRTHTQQLEVDQARTIRKVRDDFLNEHTHLTQGPKPTTIDLSRIEALKLLSRYDNPTLPHVYETWDYTLPRGVSQFEVIHATDGEVSLSGVSQSSSSNYNIHIREDGFFRFRGVSQADGLHCIFNIKRYRP